MRTSQEIVDFIRKSKESILTFTPEVLAPYLSFAEAREFLLPEAKESGWNQLPLDEEAVVAEMREYMADYGWPKATGHRGLSASRTVEKMAAWAWLLGKDDLVAFCEDEANYPMYGGPILFKICTEMNFPVPGDEITRNMAIGLPCGDPDCTGCRVVGGFVD